MHFEFLALQQSNSILLQFAVFFLLVIGLILVIVSVAFMNEQNENDESINIDFLESTIENSRVTWPPSDPYSTPQPVHGALLWKIGMLNIILNMAVFAALFFLDNHLRPWVTESMCWRLLFCIGGTWTSLYDFQLASSNMNRSRPV
jgi:hypothetical protein